MKVAYILGTFPSVSETFILREMTELRRQGIDVRIFSLRRPNTSRVPVEAVPLLPFTQYRPALLGKESLNALAHWLWRCPRGMAAVLRMVTGRIWREPVETLRLLRNVAAAACFARRADAIGVEHIHAHFAFMPADVAEMMARLMGIGFSFSAHASDIHLTAPAPLAEKIRAARFVAVCTRYGCEELVRRTETACTQKLHLIYHGVPPFRPEQDVSPQTNGVHVSPEQVGTTPRPAEIPATSLARANLPGEPWPFRVAVIEDGARPEPLVLAVGRLHAKKGFGTLIAAALILRDRGVRFRCIIVGEGPERRALETAIATYQLNGIVQLAGERPQADVIAWLQSARVFALPCIIAPDGDRDGLPNAILEALAAGVPVVTTPIAAIPEVIKAGQTGLLVPPGDAVVLAAALEELLKNDALCRRMIASGVSVVEERFNLARNVARLAELFSRIASTS